MPFMLAERAACGFPPESRSPSSFGVSPDAKLILVGSGTDPSIEAWWKLSDRRRDVIAIMASEGYELVSSPNYSLFTNQLRYDDMHSMKRIAIVQQEFAVAGIPCAPTCQTHGRLVTISAGRSTSAKREEITHISFEFATVWRWPLRRAFHLQHLKMACRVCRPTAAPDNDRRH